MRLLIVCGLVPALLTTPAVAGGGSYVLPDGTNRAPAVALHCVTPGGVAVVCGTAANPLVVSAPVGVSSAANQAVQIGAEQASSQALGTTADAAFTGGAGSMVALLKALWSASTIGVPALPAGGTLTSRTTSLPAATSTQVFAANPARKYLSFQVPQGVPVWINVIGGPAAPNAPDCAYFAPGTFYESGQFINRGAITVYVQTAVVFSAWES